MDIENETRNENERINSKIVSRKVQNLYRKLELFKFIYLKKKKLCFIIFINI